MRRFSFFVILVLGMATSLQAEQARSMGLVALPDVIPTQPTENNGQSSTPFQIYNVTYAECPLTSGREKSQANGLLKEMWTTGVSQNWDNLNCARLAVNYMFSLTEAGRTTFVTQNKSKIKGIYRKLAAQGGDYRDVALIIPFMYGRGFDALNRGCVDNQSISRNNFEEKNCFQVCECRNITSIREAIIQRREVSYICQGLVLEHLAGYNSGADALKPWQSVLEQMRELFEKIQTRCKQEKKDCGSAFAIDKYWSEFAAKQPDVWAQLRKGEPLGSVEIADW
ncbi:MAG: hypothetical protein J6Y25_06820 [Elusimicrobiaceae bacterium]|nr:hypothetical protein [Elusimicrobiaceae bacterium]